MSETLEYIDAYFTKALNEEERKQFEARCSTDDDFAKDVAFYVTAREEARQALIKQKQEWKTENEIVITKPAKKSIVLQWMPYAAAACLVLVMAFYFLFSANNPKQLASAYIEKNDTLSNTMDASRDSMQLGISEYKKKNYQQAAALFEGVKNSDSTNSYAKEYMGLAYLHLKEYNKALQCFKELSAMKDLFSNKGDMFQASTLLKRNAPGDVEAAKVLLKKVIQQKQDDYVEAENMLKKL